MGQTRKQKQRGGAATELRARKAYLSTLKKRQGPAPTESQMRALHEAMKKAMKKRVVKRYLSAMNKPRRISERSRKPAYLGEGMLTHKEFAKAQRLLVEEAEKKYKNALAVQERATEMENGSEKNAAKTAANKAVDNAKTEFDLLMGKMARLGMAEEES